MSEYADAQRLVRTQPVLGGDTLLSARRTVNDFELSVLVQFEYAEGVG